MKYARRPVIAIICSIFIILMLSLVLHTDRANPATSVSTGNNLTSTVAPTAQSTPTPEQTPVLAATNSINASTPFPTVTGIAEPGNNDDASTLIPAVTVNPNLPSTPLATPVGAPTGTPTLNFGSLPTLPPTLGLPSVPETSPIATSDFGHNAFVIATLNGLFWLSGDAKNQHQIIGGASYSQPKIAPDGLHIAVFRADPINRKTRLYLVTPDGKQQLAFENLDDLVTLNVAWSPDSKNLALTRGIDTNTIGTDYYNANLSVWLYNLQSQKLRQIAPAGRDPVWSPDGVRLAYIVPGPTLNQTDPATHQLALSPNNITVYNLQQDAKRSLANADGLQIDLKGSSSDPTLNGQKMMVRYFKQLNWSPDGKLLAASADGVTGDGKRAGLIFTLSLDNPAPQLLSSGNQAAGAITWSPDGKRIAFEGLPQFPVTVQSSHNVGIVINPDKAGPVVTKSFIGEAVNRSEASQPRWIMGGLVLAFLEGDFATLGTVDIEGQEKHLLVSGCQGFDWIQ